MARGFEVVQLRLRKVFLLGACWVRFKWYESMVREVTFERDIVLCIDKSNSS